MPSSASCRDAHAVMPRPRGIQERTASDAVVLGQMRQVIEAKMHFELQGLNTEKGQGEVRVAQRRFFKPICGGTGD